VPLLQVETPHPRGVQFVVPGRGFMGNACGRAQHAGFIPRRAPRPEPPASSGDSVHSSCMCLRQQANSSADVLLHVAPRLRGSRLGDSIRKRVLPRCCAESGRESGGLIHGILHCVRPIGGKRQGMESSRRGRHIISPSALQYLVHF
jgi:hypothetical protein